MIKVTVWNENIHEKEMDNVKKIYPKGIHGAIADFLSSDEIFVRTATLDDPECGLTEEVLADTDVLLWWGHAGHHLVDDKIAQRVKDEVLKGMGMIFLHSAHHSKPFKLLMGTSCNLCWREDGDFERLWVTNPAHPIARGIKKYIYLPHEEMYGEPFDVPEPEQLVFLGAYQGGEAFRSGCCYRRGNGNIFYFQPGHETFPTFYEPDIQKVIKNAVYWAKPAFRQSSLECPQVQKPAE